MHAQPNQPLQAGLQLHARSAKRKALGVCGADQAWWCIPLPWMVRWYSRGAAPGLKACAWELRRSCERHYDTQFPAYTTRPASLPVFKMRATVGSVGMCVTKACLKAIRDKGRVYKNKNGKADATPGT
jgi:hypothetical protein